MSDAAQGPGWWQAADGKWYPPDQPPAPGWWRASDGNWYPPAAETADASAAAPGVEAASDPAPARAGSSPTEPVPSVPTTSAPTPAEPARPETPPTPAPVGAGSESASGAASGPSAPPAGGGAPTGAAAGAPSTKTSSRGPLIAAAIVVVLILIAGIAFVATRGGDPEVATGDSNRSTSESGGQAGDGSNGDGSGGDGGSGEGGSSDISDELPSDDITLTDDVVVVNSQSGSMFKGYSSDGTALLLDPSAEGADQLEEGKILLLSGITVVRVASVDESDEGLIVTGEPVTLPEVIADGELEWDDVGLDPNTARLFTYDGEAVGGSGGGSGGGSSSDGDDDELTEDEIIEDGGGGIIDGLGGNGIRASNIAGPAPRAVPASVAVGSKTISGKVSEFSFDLTYEPTGGSGHHLKLDLTGTGDLAGTMTIDVSIGSLASSGGATIEGRQVRNFDWELSELGGDATITTDLKSTKQLTSVMTPPFLKVPFGIEFPALVGGIPFTLSITGTIQVQLSFALAGATLSGEAQISFGGDAGFHFKDGSLTVGGQRVQDAPDLLSKLAGGGGGPVGVVLTSELPKVGFGFGFLQTGAGVYLSSGMVASQTILPPPPACQSMQVAYVLAGGVEAKFLGKEFDLGRKPVVDKRWDYTVPKTAQCTAN